MEGEVIKYFITQGAFAVLFMWLLIDTRKDSKQREEKYQQTIDKLADKINIVEDIKEDVEEIKNKLNK
ncbi:BhlA/UviB family holin-like peptide [Clostridium sp.]|jgi:glucosamine 6-phosphate synthetase-like amidotransferase/phosphosugar isomerase protein|uniref:BhlA/UviB family holin-like peptide n=1 Tax=Clostridium sp. TaxID=1506 RepID=UPI0025E7CFA6|nr:BhlA/UviB family holin-like peptide [Clostridium sp.]MDU3410692.1 BhlA/UviB family holin-like peptide [Clostridium sp.]